MSNQPLAEQHGLYYNETQRIPRRTSTTSADMRERRTASRVALPPQPPPDEEEEEESTPTPATSVINKSVLRHRPIAELYTILLDNGTFMRVTEQELAALPEAYQNAAHLVTAPIAAPKPRRQPHPKLPMQDESVYEMPPARIHRPGTDALPLVKRRRSPRVHWLMWVGLVLLVVLASSTLVSLCAQWWQVTQDDWHCGRPRTYQADANVGHGITAHPLSHFLALNLNRHIEVIEIAADDPANTHIYVGPTVIGPGQDLTAVTLSFEDVNNDGKPDLVLHVGDSTYLFLNQSDGTFKPAPNQ